MFVLKLRLKSLLQDVFCLSWTFFIPFLFLLTMILLMPLKNQQNKFDIIHVAVCETTEEQKELVHFLESKVLLDNSKVFQVIVCSKKEAYQLLKEEKITGYILGTEKTLFLKHEGEKEKVLESILERYEKNKTISCLEHYMEEVQDIKMNPNMIWYFLLITFACMSGIIWGIKVCVQTNSSKTMLGKRRRLATGRVEIEFLKDTILVAIIHGVELLILLTMLLYFDGKNINKELVFIVIPSYLAGMTGILMGEILGFFGKKNKKDKYKFGIICIFFMVLFSDLVIQKAGIKVFEKMIILKWLNPASILCEAYMAWYVQNNMLQYVSCIFVLIGIIVVLFFVLIWEIRRKRYGDK